MCYPSLFADKYFRDYHGRTNNTANAHVEHWEDFVPSGYCGKCATYTQDETGKTPVPYLLHYHLRGQKLWSISRHEYSAIIDTIAVPKSEPSTHGRKCRTYYEFDHGHPFHATHRQAILLKFKTPIIMGKKVQ